MKLTVAWLAAWSLAAGVNPGLAAEVTTDYKIAPQDVVIVDVLGEEGLSKELRVSQTGEVTIHLLGNVKFAGLTASQAGEKVKELLAEDYMVNPQVTVSVKDYRRRTVSVLGQVNKPGAIELPAEVPMTIMEAIGTAGGFTRLANTDKIQVTRPGEAEGKPKEFKFKELQRNSDPKKAFILHPGDIIYVPESTF